MHGRFSASSPDDGRHQLHAVVGRRRIAARQFALAARPCRRIAPQPPGPGLPLQAPSVNISTSGLLLTARSPRVDSDAAMEAQLGEIFLRILALHQGVGRRVHPVVEPRQQEAQRRAARQQSAAPCARPSPSGRTLVVALQQRARLGGVERLVGLEAPGVQADRHVVGEGSRCRRSRSRSAPTAVVQEEARCR